jgi:acetyltransferase-like isoleucine patch superfamily enzyme
VKNKNKNLKIGYLTKLSNVNFGMFNTFYSNVSIKKSKVGDYVYVANGTKISNADIGNFCSIGQDVKIGLGMHPTHLISTHPAFFSTRKQCQITFTNQNNFQEIGKCIIGNDVWIGSNSIILDNVNIGTGAIIAAGAVVTSNVEPYTIVGGVPAKEIKKRFEKEQIKILLQSEWWTKDILWLKNNSHLFNDPDQWFSTMKKSI